MIGFLIFCFCNFLLNFFLLLFFFEFLLLLFCLNYLHCLLSFLFFLLLNFLFLSFVNFSFLSHSLQFFFLFRSQICILIFMDNLWRLFLFKNFYIAEIIFKDSFIRLVVDLFSVCFFLLVVLLK